MAETHRIVGWEPVPVNGILPVLPLVRAAPHRAALSPHAIGLHSAAMSANAELSAIFDEMSSILELMGANRFKVAAHARVARVLKDMSEDVATLAERPADLKAIDGIGDASAKKIIEFVKTGAVAEHAKLLGEIPRGLLEVLRIPGLGPKTVKLMWEKADVTDLDSLRAAMDSGRLLDVPRMGQKTIENLRASLEFASRSSQRTRLGTAMAIADAIVAHLAGLPGVGRVEFAGSLRRGVETIGDIDILAATTDAAALTEAFTTMDGVEQVLAAGATKSSVRLARGIQVDLRIVEAEAFGAALMYFTGSKQHNILLRERAIRRKLRLNEYGLFPADDEDEAPQQRGVAPVAARTEEDIYAALELPWIPPELREDRGELDRPLPALIELADIRAELHAHTVASDGKMTIETLAREAKARGLHTIAVTDHSKSSAQANGLSVERLLEHIDAVRAADGRIKGIRILAGSEVDILSDGRLDYDDDVLARLDIVVASPHVALSQDRETATRRLLAAVTHPLVHILGHPTGRYVNRRPGLQPDMAAIIRAAAEHGTALEVNANTARLDLRDTHVGAAVEAGALIAIDTDAHGPADFDQLRYGVLTARRGRLTAEGCVNTWSAKRLHGWLKKKR